MLTSEWPSPELPTAGSFVVRQVDFLRRAGVRVDVLPFQGRQRPARYVRAWRDVSRQLSGRSYDLIHAQFGQSALLALPKRVPLVVTFHGSDLQGYVGRKGKQTLAGYILSTISAWIAHRADGVILVAEHLARHLPGLAYELIPCGLDLDLFRTISQKEARAQLDLPPQRALVLFAASPENPIKRYGLAQAAVAGLEGEAELVIASGVPHELVPVYMNACDVLLLTSAHEGSPNVVKEALACNLPVVSVDVGDVRQRVGSIDGCVVCVNDRPEIIADALVQVLSRRERIQGRETVLDLDETLLTQRVIAVYEQILAS